MGPRCRLPRSRSSIVMDLDGVLPILSTVMAVAGGGCFQERNVCVIFYVATDLAAPPGRPGVARSCWPYAPTNLSDWPPRDRGRKDLLSCRPAGRKGNGTDEPVRVDSRLDRSLALRGCLVSLTIVRERQG